MKKVIYILILSLCIISCKEISKKKNKDVSSDKISNQKSQIIQVAEFKGQQVTGVTVSSTGRIFVNFPRWRKNVNNSVVEVTDNQHHKVFPNSEWNSWETGNPVNDQKFIGVQSVVAFEDKLYVLDTRNPLFGDVLDAPRIFVFNLNTNALERTYIVSKESYHSNSYINDLRVDKKHNKIYCTDSGRPGLVVLDLSSGKSKRVLDNHYSTKAEQSYLSFNNTKWNNTVHSDGIALDTKNDKLYYHSLTGYSLYSISTKILEKANNEEVEKAVTLAAKTSAPDGMIFDKSGNLYFADLENNKIMYRKPDGSIYTLAQGVKVKWADTFSIYDNYLYYTNSRINEVGNDISDMTFTLNRVELPNK